jgi:hypothetical protein
MCTDGARRGGAPYDCAGFGGNWTQRISALGRWTLCRIQGGLGTSQFSRCEAGITGQNCSTWNILAAWRWRHTACLDTPGWTACGAENVPRNVPRRTILVEWEALGAASRKWLVLLGLGLRRIMPICACCSEWGFWAICGKRVNSRCTYDRVFRICGAHISKSRCGTPGNSQPICLGESV